MQRELKFGAYVGMPWKKEPKLREIREGELFLPCFECGELKLRPDEPIICRECQEKGEICR